MKTLSLAIAMAIALASSAALAQSAGDQVQYLPHTEIILGGSVIEGELVLPGTGYVQSRRASRFSPRIGVRANFLHELAVSSDQL